MTDVFSRDDIEKALAPIPHCEFRVLIPRWIQEASGLPELVAYGRLMEWAEEF